ncbi:MAG: aminomethyl-transferring glycine dehydrogenase subunit GcvPA [Calditrichaeota bacterium]|nr:aminomethyl-transferring glycine dehydrogenase subunit GcvPA [Calditrichota bacterium]
MGFVPNTKDDQKAMLKKIGVEKFQDLLSEIPPELLFEGDLELPQPMSEMEVMAHLRDLANKNENCEDNICFLGGGAYDHFIPAAVKHIVSRPEFYTAYTPYQPEVSQGTLQAIYEYQTMICELTGMDVANDSVYDGGSALAEAMLLACGYTRRKEILVSAAVNPNYLEIIKTYSVGRDIAVKVIDWVDGATDLNKLADSLSENTAAVIVQHPNFFGYLEDVDEISELTHKHGALFVTSNDPISLAILKPPSEYGTDIVTGEGQSLGNPLNFGGPYLGIFAATKALLRKIPGRIVGRTLDRQGKDGFVLTLQTREQHIRREKATSNICSNEALNALAATVYMALMGKNGLRKVAELCLQKSHHLAGKISELDGFEQKFKRPFFKEFVIASEHPVEDVLAGARERKIFAGIHLAKFDDLLKDSFLCTVTEKRTRKEMDKLIHILGELF